MARKHLNNRRESLNFTFEFDFKKYHACMSCYPNGKPAELFLDADKPGSAVELALKDTAIFISLCLQYGTPIETLQRAALRREDGVTPATHAGAAIDALANIVKDLPAKTFLVTAPMSRKIKERRQQGATYIQIATEFGIGISTAQRHADEKHAEQQRNYERQRAARKRVASA